MSASEAYDRISTIRASARRSRFISPDDVVRFPSDVDDVTRGRIDRLVELQSVNNLALRSVSDCKAETENVLRIETNQNKAIRAHLVATKGQGLFGEIKWLGAFIDENGAFYVFIERNRDWKLSYSFGTVEGSYLDDVNADALGVFKDLVSPAVFNGKPYDRFTQPYDLGKLKRLHEEAVLFQRNYGLIDLKDFVLRDLRQSREEVYLLDYRKHLLSPGEFLTADILDSKDFRLRDLNLEEAERNATRRLYSMGGAIDFPMTERGAATFARCLELDVGQTDATGDGFLDHYSRTIPTTPDVQITSDRQVAAKAFLVARFGTKEFLPLSWLGEFSDDEGIYYAYLKAGYTQDIQRATLQDMFFSDPEQLLEDWETMKKDVRANPATIRYQRQYAELRRKADQFALTTGLAVKAPDDGANLVFVREAISDDLRLDGERVLPDLSTHQIGNVLIAAKSFTPKSS
jgi:hypothetical protein